MLLVCAAVLASAAPRAIVLTTDCGADIDDQWVIAHLASSPEFDLRAIVTTHTGSHAILAAPAAETSARIAREVLDQIAPRKRPEVIPGSSIALTSRRALENPGVARIIAESRKFDARRRLTIVVIGAATDTASALLADPSIADRIEIVAMGFKGSSEGGDEFNVTNDPIAWQTILESRVPVTIGGSTVTKRDLSLTSTQAHQVLKAPKGAFLTALFDQWLANQRQIVVSVMGTAERWPVWDEVTTAYMLGMTKSQEQARPKLRPDFGFDAGARGTIRWITQVDAQKLFRDLNAKLGAN